MIANGYVKTFTEQYLITGLWSELDDGGEPLDRTYTIRDITPASIAAARGDCHDFVTAAGDDLVGMDPGQAGHLFWLTRNRHGAGFWDSGLGERGDRLTVLSKAYGEARLYIGDGSRVHYDG